MEAARWALGATKGWAAPGCHLAAMGPPAVVLLASSLFLLGNNSYKLAAHSEKLLRTTFLKKKTAEDMNWHWASC